MESDVCVIPPNSFALASTVEYFRIPRNSLDRVPGQEHLRPLWDHREMTLLEPEWEGHVTLEFSNTTTLPENLRRRGCRPDAFLRER